MNDVLLILSEILHLLRSIGLSRAERRHRPPNLAAESNAYLSAAACLREVSGTAGKQAAKRGSKHLGLSNVNLSTVADLDKVTKG